MITRILVVMGIALGISAVLDRVPAWSAPKEKAQQITARDSQHTGLVFDTAERKYVDHGPLPANFEEKPLSEYAGPRGEAYRVAIDPFIRSPWLVRIVRQGDSYSLVSKQLSGEGAYFLGKVMNEVSRPLTAEEWSQFKTRLTAARFWSKKTAIPVPLVLDSTTYWIEGYSNGKTLSNNRYCLGILPEDAKLAEAADFFLSKSAPPYVFRSGNSLTKHRAIR